MPRQLLTILVAAALVGGPASGAGAQGKKAKDGAPPPVAAQRSDEVGAGTAERKPHAEATGTQPKPKKILPLEEKRKRMLRRRGGES